LQAGNLLLVEYGGDVGAVGLQLWLRFGVRFDGFGCTTRLKGGIDAGATSVWTEMPVV